MNFTRAKAVVLDMAFGTMALYARFTRDVRKDSTVTQNILRGRVAPEGAWMQVELRGVSRRIEDLVERWKDFIVAAGDDLAA